MPAPNLQLIAKADSGAEAEAAILAGLVLALAVRSNQAEVHVTKIQGFDEWVQKELMMAIEQVSIAGDRVPRRCGDEWRRLTAMVTATTGQRQAGFEGADSV